MNHVNHDMMIEMIKKCKFVISDSGGLQEECSHLNKKIIICRKNTERPEILNTFGYLCSKPELLEEQFNFINNNYKVNDICPFGDGNSWKKIKNILEELL
jgi:UDP-N-acetylglucosamine 2-epimerase (non-hydrolysing)